MILLSGVISAAHARPRVASLPTTLPLTMSTGHMGTSVLVKPRWNHHNISDFPRMFSGKYVLSPHSLKMTRCRKCSFLIRNRFFLGPRLAKLTSVVTKWIHKLPGRDSHYLVHNDWQQCKATRLHGQRRNRSPMPNRIPSSSIGHPFLVRPSARGLNLPPRRDTSSQSSPNL